MKRYMIANKLGTGVWPNVFRPDISGSWVVVAERPNRYLVKTVVPDGTAPDDNTLADMTADETEIATTALTVAQRNRLRNWIENNYPDWLATFDGWTDDDDGTVGITNRRRWFRLVVRVFDRSLSDWFILLHGYSVGG